MGKGKAFAAEVETISSMVDRDVGRVMTLLRDESTNEAKNTASTTPPNVAPAQPGSHAPLKHAQTQPMLTSDEYGSHTDGGRNVVLENVTTRLTRETNQRLTEAALRQKLSKHTPDSRQAIIEQALIEWFERHDYIR